MQNSRSLAWRGLKNRINGHREVIVVFFHLRNLLTTTAGRADEKEDVFERKVLSALWLKQSGISVLFTSLM